MAHSLLVARSGCRTRTIARYASLLGRRGFRALLRLSRAILLRCDAKRISPDDAGLRRMRTAMESPGKPGKRWESAGKWRQVAESSRVRRICERPPCDSLSQKLSWRIPQPVNLRDKTVEPSRARLPDLRRAGTNRGFLELVSGQVCIGRHSSIYNWRSRYVPNKMTPHQTTDFTGFDHVSICVREGKIKARPTLPFCSRETRILGEFACVACAAHCIITSHHECFNAR